MYKYLQKIIFSLFIYNYLECLGIHLSQTNNSLIRVSRQIEGKICQNPVILNGRFDIVNPKITYINEYYVPSLTVVNFTCSDTHQLSPPLIKNILICIDGEWNGEIPQCIQKCPTRTSQEVIFRCTSFGFKINCSKAVEGTIMEMTCKNNFSPSTEAICKNGFWTKPIKSCQAECGKRLDPNSNTLFVNSSPAKQGEFPWHVAIYMKNSKTNNEHKYVCGGSLIHVNLVLTAAHCVTSSIDGRLYNTADYFIEAGKYYSDYNSSLDTYAQKRHVVDTKVPATYRGVLTEYAADIAVLTVNEPFDISGVVRLVCIDWNPSKENDIFATGAIGYVAGWGIKDINVEEKSNELRTLSIPSISHEDCLNETFVPKKFFKLVTPDKFCAGYLNGSSACYGDSGSGLVYGREQKSITYYFVEGLVSAGPSFSNGTCDYTKYSIYTKISNYLEFLKLIMRMHKIEPPIASSEDCDVPTIENGYFTVSDIDYIPDSTIKESSIITIKCNNGYKLSSANKQLVCSERSWNNQIPKCIVANIQSLTKITEGGCPVPQIENGKFHVLGNAYAPGQPIPNYAIVNFTCNSDSFGLTTTYNNVLCLNGNFQNELPKCVRTCPALLSTSVDIVCELNGIKQDCTKKVLEGTIAGMKCKLYYVQIGRGFSTAFCSDGSWDVPLRECSPDCGELVPEVQYFIVNGKPVKRGQFPWHVAIYRQEPHKPRVYICGGSIISETIILSAAHCFTDPNNGTLYPASEFTSAAGKYFSNWDAPEDAQNVQKKDIIKIEIPKDIYKGNQSNYLGDIAVVIVDSPFVLTNLIRPVCVDWYSEIVEHLLTAGKLGQVPGWGSTTTGNPVASVDLKQLIAPFIDRGQCLEIVPQDFQVFVTIDKYCAGYTNETSVCKGDDGGGMVLPMAEYRRKRYYIGGIVSFASSNCDDRQLGVFTKLNYYINFIKKFHEVDRIK